MKCEASPACCEEAVLAFSWPGQPQRFACQLHTSWAAEVALKLGFMLITEPWWLSWRAQQEVKGAEARLTGKFGVPKERGRA